MEVPSGFAPHTVSAFAASVGPLFRRFEDGVPVLGVRTEARHANMMGAVHGGLVLTLADTALGSYIRSLVGEGRAVTVDMHATFLRGARIGQWVEARPSLERLGRQMAFATATVVANGTEIARVSGSFFIRRPREVRDV